jgi:HupE / UreJ protein
MNRYPPHLLLRLALLCLVFLGPHAWAHKASDAYLQIKQAESSAPMQLQLAIALRDVDRALDTLDANNDRALSFGEIKAALPSIEAWVEQGLVLRCGSSQTRMLWRYEALEQRSDGVFIRLSASASTCDAQQSMALRYTLMQDIDADHRAIASLDEPARQGSVVLAPGTEWVSLAAGAADAPGAFSGLRTLGSFIVLGMEHIGSGADHIAFIICLVLGLALVHAREWKTLLITITAFTIGHSITLISASLGWVGSPGWVEPVIALSIAMAAAFNLMKSAVQRLRSVWLSAGIAASFGLVHGLGFSGAMTEAQVSSASLLWALAGFNVGVELGQLVIIAMWSLVYWSLYRWAGYQRWVVQGGSMALVVLSLYWFAQRVGWLT